MTAIGSGAARSATRSKVPLASAASSRSPTVWSIVVAYPAIILGLNAGAATRRSRAWSGSLRLRKERSNSSCGERTGETPVSSRTPNCRLRSTWLQMA